MVFQAHAPSGGGVQPARSELLQRYCGAVYRYLLAVVEDQNLAEELSQQFLLKFLEGDFHKADPARGRFRDYVKSALVNLVRRHYRVKSDAPRPLPETLQVPGLPPEVDDTEDEFTGAWRTAVMDQTWKTLHEQRPVYHNLLRLRVDEPSLKSRDLAEQYTAQFDKPMTPANVRKSLQRAHVKFADLLVAEVASSLENPTEAVLRAELKELDLLKYCRSAIDRWTRNTAN